MPILFTKIQFHDHPAEASKNRNMGNKTVPGQQNFENFSIFTHTRIRELAHPVLQFHDHCFHC